LYILSFFLCNHVSFRYRFTGDGCVPLFPTPRGFCHRPSLSSPQGGSAQTPLGWVESNGCCFQSLARRSRYLIWPLKFELKCFPTQTFKFESILGLRNRFGAPKPFVIWTQLHARPAQIWPCACVPGPNSSEPSREGRASVYNRGPLRAASARYSQMGSSDFGVGKTAIF
jgi:hypothetical protein